MAQNKYIEKVAIVGAGGRIGNHFVEELRKTGKHTVTALTRADSKSTIAAGVKTVQVNYDDEKSLVSALQGQQFLIITLANTTPHDTHSKIVQAAVKAGVPYIMPNVYGGDIENEALVAEDLYSGNALKKCEEIQSLGSAYIAMACGYWYEWSLARGEKWFGFDIKNRKVTFFDDGKTKINASTWKQCGRALAALLNLPEDGATPALIQWKNKSFFLSSFRISQSDMLDSLHRIIGTTDKDWEITYEPTAHRYKDGVAEMKNGDRTGFAKAMYSRTFYPNGDGDYESSRGTVNDLLGLPREDLDEATKRTVEMIENGSMPFG